MKKRRLACVPSTEQTPVSAWTEQWFFMPVLFPIACLKNRNVRKSISRLAPTALSVLWTVLSYNCISVFLFWIIQEAIWSPLFDQCIRPLTSHEAANGEVFSVHLPTPNDLFLFLTRFITSIWQVGSWDDTKTLNDLAKVIQEIWDGAPNIRLLLISKPALKPLDILLNFQVSSGTATNFLSQFLNHIVPLFPCFYK